MCYYTGSNLFRCLIFILCSKFNIAAIIINVSQIYRVFMLHRKYNFIVATVYIKTDATSNVNNFMLSLLAHIWLMRHTFPSCLKSTLRVEILNLNL